MPIGNPVTLTSNVASKTISVTATASQTLFNVTGGYRINELGVFKNGSRLQDGVDYTARDGLTVTLLSAASGGDKLQFVVFDTFRVAEAIRPNVDEQTIRGNLNVVGILSATNLEGPLSFNLTSGIQTFHDVRVGGALTVAGSLTYEDTTNTNTVGLATFSGGMNISGVGATITTLNVTGFSTFSDNVSIGDSIFHTGDTDTSIRFPAADTFTVETGGTERLRIDSSGRFGIGTTSPSEQLHITGSLYAESRIYAADGAAATPSIRFYNSNVGLYSPGSSALGFSAGNSERARIDSSGRLLVGTFSDYSSDTNSRLAIESTEGGRMEFSSSKTTVTTGQYLGALRFWSKDGNTQLSAFIAAQADGTHATDDKPGRLVFSTTADGASSPTERMRISSNGQVNIEGLGSAATPALVFGSDTNTGIYSPGADQVAVATNGAGRLFVASDGSIEALSGTSDRNLIVRNTGNNTRLQIKTTAANKNSEIWFGDADDDDVGIIDYDHDGDYLRFYTNASEKLRIDSSGRLLVGTSSAPTAGNAQYALAAIKGYAGGPNDTAYFALLRGEAATSITANEGIGEITFGDQVGNPFSRIRCEADGTAGASDYPGRLVFSTTADGASSPTERLRITSDGKVRVPDNGKFTCGAGDDLQIYHDGTDSYIDDAGTGELKIRSNVVRLRKYTGETMAVFVADGGAVLYHDNSNKFETTSTGVTVTGTLNATTAVTQNGNALATAGKAVAMALVFG